MFLGWAAVLGRAAEHLAGAAFLVLASVSGFARLPDYRDAYFRAPSEAGALLQEAGGPASGQLTAWVAEGVDPVPRWVSYYWGLPVSEAAAAVEGGSVGAGDLVLVCLDRLPRWMHPVPEPFAQRGRYALMTGASLRGKAGPQGRPDRLTAFPGPRSFSKRTPVVIFGEVVLVWGGSGVFPSPSWGMAAGLLEG